MTNHAVTPATVFGLRRALQALAALLLIGAVVFGVMAWQARQQQASVALPSHLLPLTDGAVWLAMDRQLWLLDRDGAVESRLTPQQAGLPSMPVVWARLDPPRHGEADVNLDQLTAEGEPMPHVGPTQLIVLLEGTTQAHVLGARTGRLQHRIMLQWPPDLKAAAAEPTALAVHPDGRMAIALGKVGVVAVFAPQGALIARSVPDTYAASRLPTEGLWWDGETLWGADAERHALVRFKGSDLSVRDRLTLPQERSRPNMTTVALGHPNAGTEAVSPLATLIRLDSDLIEGRVAHVWADGLEKNEDLGEGARPGSIAWLGDTLVVAENRDIRLRRFDIDRQPLPDLGDRTVQQTLATLRQSRDHWIHRMLIWLGGAFGCTVLALALLARAIWRRGAPPVAAPDQGDQHTAAERGAPHDDLRLPSRSRPSVVAASPSPTAWYPLLGDAFHQAAAWTQCRQDINERLRETFTMGSGATRGWIVLTNRRLLAFSPVANGQGWQLDKDWHRSDIATISMLPRDRLSWAQKRQMPSNDCAWLRLKTREGQSLEGFVQPVTTAERIHAIVSLTARPPD